MLDADEMLDFEQAKAVLPGLLQAPGMSAYGLWRWNYLSGDALSRTPLKKSQAVSTVCASIDAPHR